MHYVKMVSLIRLSIKYSGKSKWDKGEYHVQDNLYIDNTSVKNSFDSTQFTAFLFYVIHAKPHGVHGLKNHYHFSLYFKLGHG